MCNKTSYKVFSIWKTKQIFRGGCESPAIFRIILFVKTKQLKGFKKCYRGFWRNCKLIKSIDTIREWDPPTLWLTMIWKNGIVNLPLTSTILWKVTAPLSSYNYLKRQYSLMLKRIVMAVDDCGDWDRHNCFKRLVDRRATWHTF